MRQLAAYNLAGEAPSRAIGGIPPYPETRNYVTQVRSRLQKTAAPKETSEPVSAVQRSEANPVETAASVAVAIIPIREVMGADGKVHYVSR